MNALAIAAFALAPLSSSCADAGSARPPADRDAATATTRDATTATPVADAAVEAPTVDAASPDASPEAAPTEAGQLPFDPDAAPPAGAFCSLPGSVVWTAQGPMVMPGGPAADPDLTWLHVPSGFCTHYFATVKTARQLKFAPGGELFAASPTMGTTGGAGDGIAGIVVLPDDNHDGTADSNITFLDQLPSVQGLLFAKGYFYYQDGATIRRVAYAQGDRQPSAPTEVVTTMTNWPQAAEHWPKVFDQARNGTIYVSNGGSQSDVCDATWPVRGAVFQLNADGSTRMVAMGFRNPIAMRCEPNHDVCLVAELALDYSWNSAGREKLVPLREGDNWGFPCCATKDIPYAAVVYSGTTITPDCSGVAVDGDSFVIGHTPFGLDFETGTWPAPWTNRVFVTLHGDAGVWSGARVVAIALDQNGIPLPATELEGGTGDPSNMLEFATGWDNGRRDHGRPAPVTFAPDGRMFIGDDQSGAVVWMAPVDLMR
jgi:glucose/arabinose dehydrogenase